MDLQDFHCCPNTTSRAYTTIRVSRAMNRTRCDRRFGRPYFRRWHGRPLQSRSTTARNYCIRNTPKDFAVPVERNSRQRALALLRRRALGPWATTRTGPRVSSTILLGLDAAVVVRPGQGQWTPLRPKHLQVKPHYTLVKHSIRPAKPNEEIIQAHLGR